MLNEERIKLMTKMAAYEEHGGKKNITIGSFFRGDYIGLQVLKSVICATIAYAILFGMFIVYDFEVFMLDIYKMDLLGFGKKVFLYYFIFVAAYSLISYIVHSIRYNRAKKSLKKYNFNLKQLTTLYEMETKK